MFDAEFRLMLMPLPSSSSSSASSGNSLDEPSRKRLRALEYENQRLQKQLKVQQNTEGGKGKGQGKGRNGKCKKKGPKEFIGKVTQHSNGDPICYNFNLPRGCPNAKPGLRCGRGWHVCAEPGCLEPHSMQKHRS